jgi:hypothetical protein
LAEARECFIDAVVDDFVREMIGRVVSVYMPGRRRTGSKPLNTSISEAV